jgi:hypothetical protein
MVEPSGFRMSSSPHSASDRVKAAGLAMLVIGLVAAACVFFVAAPGVDADLVAQQREMREVARLGGTAAVQTVKLHLWFASLWHGERLAWTLALLSLAVGGSCFYVAGLMDEDVEE